MIVGKYQTYPEYKGSGAEWLEDVPCEWEVKPCRAVVRNIAEKNTGVLDRNYLSLMANVGVIRYEDKGDIGNKKPDDLSKCKIVKKGNLVINSMNYAIGSYGMSEYDGVCSPVYIVLDVNKHVVQRRFALRVFENRPFQKYLSTFGNGILEHRAAIGWDDIKGADIPVPTREEQLSILNFLDHETIKIDILIEKQRQLIKLLKEKRQAVISHAVTKGLNPDAPMKSSGVEWLGDVPEHWNITEIRYIANQIGGGTPSKDREEYWNGDIPWVTPKDMKEDYIQDSQDKITGQAINNSSVKFVPKGSVLIVVRGMILLHSVPVALVLKKLTVNQDMKALIPVYNVCGEYLLFLLKGLRYFILDLVDNSAHGTKCLRTEIFERMKIAIPNINEQNEIIAQLRKKLEGIDSLFEKTYLSIELLKERRTALISAAVTGKIDVRNWQPPVQNQTNKENVL